MIHCTNQQLTRPDLQSHIYSRALLDNVAALRSLCPPVTKFCAVVKADAYGHGITEIVNILRNADVDFFAVASIYEALYIQPLIGGKPVLILEPIVPNDVPENIFIRTRFNFHSVIASFEAMDFVASLFAGTDGVLDLHVNVESGMSRCGIDVDCAAQLIDRIESCPNTRLAGVYTHFATADEEDLSYAYEQLDRFRQFLEGNDLSDRRDIIVHCANSAATIKMPEAHFDMVRCGIAMYGYYSRPMIDPPIRLRPVMKLQAPIVQLKSIPAGRSVSYGRSFTTSRDTIAAIIPLGYADGYWRCFSNKAKMKIGDAVVGVIGRVCMDQLIIDVTDVPDADVGVMVTVIDDDHNSPCGVYALADLADTICYEILTCIHPHVKRVVHY
jgi:alanine racemase